MGTGKAILVVVCALQLTFCMAAFDNAAAAAPPAAGNNDIAKTVKALRQAKTPEDDAYGVPPDVGILLTKLKHQLRDMVQTALAAYDGAGGTRTVEQAVQNSLRRQGVRYMNDKGGPFGYLYPISIKKVKGHSDLVAVTTTIGISCGSDSSLYIFKKKGEGWAFVLADEAGGYTEVNGGRESFDYYVSPPERSGQFFVVTKDTATWCTSYWRGLRCRVFRPGAEPYKPRVLLERKTSIVVWKDGGKLTGRPDGFRMDFLGGIWIQPEDIARKHIESYQVSGDRVVRVAPLAGKPEDFLDEWADLKWEEALQWVEPEVRSKARVWHEAFRKERHREATRPFFLYLSMYPAACKTGRDGWQIGFVIEPSSKAGKLPPDIPERVYFDIAREKGVYYVKDVSEKIVEKCRATLAE